MVKGVEFHEEGDAFWGNLEEEIRKVMRKRYDNFTIAIVTKIDNFATGEKPFKMRVINEMAEPGHFINLAKAGDKLLEIKKLRRN